jgi:hypothetical protein
MPLGGFVCRGAAQNKSGLLEHFAPGGQRFRMSFAHLNHEHRNHFMKTTHKPTTTSTLPTDAAEFVIPNEKEIMAKLCDAFQNDGISAEIDEGTIDLQTDETGLVACDLCLETRELRLWTPIFMPRPNSEGQRAVLLNTLNRDSVGARFYQANSEEFIEATDIHLIGAEGLVCSTAVEFARTFIWQLKEARNFLMDEGCYDDPSDSQEDDDGKGGQ